MARAVPTSAVDAVKRGLVAAALLWEALWIVSQPALWPQGQSNVVCALAIVGAIGAWALLVAFHLFLPAREFMARINVVALSTAAAVLMTSTISTGEPGLIAVTELGALAVGVAGLLVPGRYALALLGGTVIGLVWALVGVSASGATLGADVWLLDSAYVLAVGLAASASRRALLRGATASDAAASRVLVAMARLRTTEAVEASLRSRERLLHEQVLNTLIAIARGGIDEGAVERMRERCGEGARLLRSLRTWGESTPGSGINRSPSLTGIDTILAELAHAGVEASVALPDLTQAPARVQEAFRVAVHEALRNVLRHAGASRVSVDGTSSGAGSDWVISVRVRDDGIGLPAEQPPFGFGVQDAILGPMAEVGGTAEVRGAVGGGVDVLLTWSAVEPPEVDASASLVPSPSALSIPVLASLSVYVSAMVLASWAEATSPFANVLALTIWVASAIAVALITRRARLGWPMVVAVAASGWVAYALQQEAFSDGSLVGWASPAIAALFLVVAATGPMWGWVVLAGAWLLFQGDPVHELVQPGTAMILVGAILNRSLRRNAQAAWRHATEEAEQATMAATARQRLDRLAQRFAGLDSSSAAQMLECLASSAADPGSPGIRDQAMREERYLRNVLKTDPGVDALHATASDLIREAHERNLLVDVSLSAGAGLALVASEREVGGLHWAVRHSDATPVLMGQLAAPVARLTSFAEGETVVLRLVAELGAHADPPTGVMIDDSGLESALWMWEARWTCSGR